MRAGPGGGSIPTLNACNRPKDAVLANPPDRIAQFAVSPATSSAHLDALTASGRQFLTICQYAKGLRGNATLRPRSVLITVGDGFADFANNAPLAQTERDPPRTTGTHRPGSGERISGGRHAAVRPPHRCGSSWCEDRRPVPNSRPARLPSECETAAKLSRSGDLLAGTLERRNGSFAYSHSYWRRRVWRLVGEAGFQSAYSVGEAFSSVQDHPPTVSRPIVWAGINGSTAAWMNGSSARVLSRQHRVLAFGCRRAQHIRQASA